MSQSASNAVDRILTGKPMKFTVRIHKADGAVVEFQHDHGVKLKWEEATRSVWVYEEHYNGGPICEHEPGMVILTEENPKP